MSSRVGGCTERVQKAATLEKPGEPIGALQLDEGATLGKIFGIGYDGCLQANTVSPGIYKTCIEFLCITLDSLRRQLAEWEFVRKTSEVRKGHKITRFDPCNSTRILRSGEYILGFKITTRILQDRLINV